MAKHNEIGIIGENIASVWLKEHGFQIIDKNYRKKFGEIDIVAREASDSYRFIEVKTVSYETMEKLEHAISRETWRPEENVHRLKQDRFRRAIQSWLLENQYQGNWQIDVLTVRLVLGEKYAVVKSLENLIFE